VGGALGRGLVPLCGFLCTHTPIAAGELQAGRPRRRSWPYRDGAMRPLGFLCRPTLVRRGCVHKNAAVQCSSAVPGYPPSPGLALFIRVRGIGILGSSYPSYLNLWSRYRREPKMIQYCSLVMHNQGRCGRTVLVVGSPVPPRDRKEGPRGCGNAPLRGDDDTPYHRRGPPLVV
jgi:hypothetical protein